MIGLWNSEVTERKRKQIDNRAVRQQLVKWKRREDGGNNNLIITGLGGFWLMCLKRKTITS